MIIGAITGGWFGDLFVEYFGWTGLNSIVLFETMGEGGILPQLIGQPGIIIFLILSILIGVIHLDIGIIISMIENFKERKIKDAFLGDFWFILIQPAILLLLFNSSYIFIVALCVVALILLVWGHKGMFFFQITGMLGDTLSYVRLMALGLCTYGMALTFNALANLAGGPGIGIIIAAIIAILGHLLNWALQTLGGFVHTMRLHYVEFFGKFFKGEGSEFIPFKERREKTLLMEE